MITCTQDDCKEIATHYYDWLGKECYTCEKHKSAVHKRAFLREISPAYTCSECGTEYTTEIPPNEQKYKHWAYLCQDCLLLKIGLR